MMDRRVPALVLLLLAAGVYGGVAVPARRASAQAGVELARVRAEAESLRRRVAVDEPQRAALHAWRQAGETADGSVTGLRRLLLQAVAGARVSGVRLSVAATHPPLAASARLAALGSYPDLVDLSERLIGPRTGVVPDRLRFTVAGSELSFDLEGVVLGPAR
jgi:hypothetical protein